MQQQIYKSNTEQLHGEKQANLGKSITDNRPVAQKQLKGMKKTENGQYVLQAKKNQNGLPEKLKTGIEQLSGISMDGVQVHYHSQHPARVNADAFAQGNDIHLGAGQE